MLDNGSEATVSTLEENDELWVSRPLNCAVEVQLQGCFDSRRMRQTFFCFGKLGDTTISIRSSLVVLSIIKGLVDFHKFDNFRHFFRNEYFF